MLNKVLIVFVINMLNLYIYFLTYQSNLTSVNCISVWITCSVTNLMFQNLYPCKYIYPQVSPTKLIISVSFLKICCAYVLQGCRLPLVVKFADTQKEKEMKKLQQVNSNLLQNLASLGSASGIGNLSPQYLAVSSFSLNLLK